MYPKAQNTPSRWSVIGQFFCVGRLCFLSAFRYWVPALRINCAIKVQKRTILKDTFLGWLGYHCSWQSHFDRLGGKMCTGLKICNFIYNLNFFYEWNYFKFINRRCESSIKLLTGTACKDSRVQKLINCKFTTQKCKVVT